MRSFKLLILFGYFVVFAAGRPSGVQENIGDREIEESEYENGGEEALEDDTAQEDEEISAVGFSDNKPGQTYAQDEKPDSNADREFQSSLVHRSGVQTNNEDENYRSKNAIDQASDQDILVMKDNDDKKMTASQDESSNEAGDVIFETNENRNGQMNPVVANSYNNEQADLNAPSRYYKKEFNNNNIRMDTRKTEEVNKYSGRDRRELQSHQKEDSSNENKDIENDEEEEAAIRRHVKKLSGEELEELLNSLSGDKRELLKRIMENDPENTKDSVSKREITKKAGAAEENIETALLDNIKLQSGSEGTASPSSIGSSSPDSIKSQEPQTEIMTTKGVQIPSSTTDSSNRDDSTNTETSHGITSVTSLDESKIQANSNSNLQTNAKAEIKREANINDLANYEVENNFRDSEYLDNNDQYMCPSDNDLSKLLDNEPQSNDLNGNLYKRDTNSATDAELADSFKSLEESFPNSNKYDDSDPYGGSDMAPLVRVKRNNEDISVKKRAAALLPDAKVAFFPYRSETDDLDADESNEFDDDGFYDRSSKVERNYDIPKKTENEETPFQKIISRKSQSNVVAQSKVESDTSNSLGSDTDNVLSGVEGVDENLMLNSALRNRRTADDNLNLKKLQENLNKQLNRQARSTTSANYVPDSPSENNMGVPNIYQEHDAFGPLPRNYDSELNRYKRIRHVKQQSGSRDAALDT